MPGVGAGKRLPLEGGPLHGEQVATHLYVRTGRGKNTAHISIPLVADRFFVKTDNHVSGWYARNGEGYQWELEDRDDGLPEPTIIFNPPSLTLAESFEKAGLSFSDRYSEHDDRSLGLKH